MVEIIEQNPHWSTLVLNVQKSFSDLFSCFFVFLQSRAPSIYYRSRRSKFSVIKVSGELFPFPIQEWYIRASYPCPLNYYKIVAICLKPILTFRFSKSQGHSELQLPRWFRLNTKPSSYQQNVSRQPLHHCEILQTILFRKISVTAPPQSDPEHSLHLRVKTSGVKIQDQSSSNSAD